MKASHVRVPVQKFAYRPAQRSLAKPMDDPNGLSSRQVCLVQELVDAVGSFVNGGADDVQLRREIPVDIDLRADARPKARQAFVLGGLRRFHQRQLVTPGSKSEGPDNNSEGVPVDGFDYAVLVNN